MPLSGLLTAGCGTPASQVLPEEPDAPAAAPPSGAPAPEPGPAVDTARPLPEGIIAVRTGAEGDGSSWTAALGDLQAALAQARESQGAIREVWVAAGIYRPAADGGDPAEAFRLPDGVALYGGFAGTEASAQQRELGKHVTVLSGDLQGDDAAGTPGGDNTLTVLAIEHLQRVAIIDGFEITAAADSAVRLTAASATLRNCRIAGNRGEAGAGVRVTGPAAAAFITCTLRDNAAAGRGGAVFSEGANLSFGDCVFERNGSGVGGGALAVTGGRIRLMDCALATNQAPAGGAIHSHADQLLLEGCVLRQNQATAPTDAGNSPGTAGAAGTPGAATAGAATAGGGAIYCDLPAAGAAGTGDAAAEAADTGAAVLTASHCIFESNTAATVGGAIHGAGRAWLGGCLFDRNSAPAGGGGYLEGPAELVNCTLSGNAASGSGGGLYADGAALTLINSILWGNFDAGGAGQASQLAITSDLSGVIVSGSCIQALSQSLAARGTGNTATDPMFIDAPMGNLRLHPQSACIDTGIAWPGVDALATDLDAEPRVQGRIDMGAYEQ